MGQQETATIETLDGAVARMVVRRGSWLVGRGPEAHLKLYSDQVSPRHAWVRRDARGTWVSDAGSRTGTRVNGQPLEPRQARLLRHGDHLAFGPIQAVYADPGRHPAAGDTAAEIRLTGHRVLRPAAGRAALVFGPVMIVAGLGLGASRLLRYVGAGPELFDGVPFAVVVFALPLTGFVVTAVGLALAKAARARRRGANRPQWR
jgi:hypothetical protein